MCTVILTRMVEATLSASTRTPYSPIIVRPCPQPEMDFRKTKNNGVILKVLTWF